MDPYIRWEDKSRLTPKGLLSANADHNPNHVRFQRQHTGPAPDPIKPMRGWGYDILNGVCWAAITATIIIITLYL